MILSNQCVTEKKKARKKFKGSQNQVKMEADYGELTFKKQQDLKLT